MPRRKADDIAKYQAVDEDALIIPKEKIEKPLPSVIELKASEVSRIVAPEKKPPTEAQLEARRKFVEFN